MTDRDRAVALRPQLVAAIDELTGIRSTDPAAATAMHAVRLAESTLAERWLPALDRVLADQ